MPRPEEILYPTTKERFEDRRKEGEQRRLRGEFFDHSTLLAVSRLVTQGQFDALDYPIATGKEGGVFRATSGETFRAVKVYRIGNSIFRRLPPYAIEELRKEASDRNFAGLVFAWTRREHTILRRLYAAGVRVPQPYGYRRNVLVMDFIGTEGIAAPRLKESVVSDPAQLYEDLVTQVRRMVVDAHLVHGDLSPYNILLAQDLPVLIDVAQSISSLHPQAKTLLARDIANFAKYFRRLGLKSDAREMFQSVGGDTVSLPRGTT
jgi:RIO kinase 1